MIRLLVWNVQNFSEPKINDTTNAQTAQESADRFGHIVNEVFAPNPNNLPASPNLPDIFVLLEVGARIHGVIQAGIVLQDNTASCAGLLLLLGALRAFGGPAADWCLVPPVPSGDGGYREGVAVFFNANVVQFVGPWIHTAADTVDDPAGGAAAAAYGGAWAAHNALRHTAIPGTALFSDEMGGQWQYPGLAFPSNWHRAPFLTQFLQVGGAGAGRTISLYSVHTSPAFAVGAVQELANLPFTPAAGADVNVVAGDFNVDTFDQNKAGSYGLLLGLHPAFVMMLDPRVPGTGVVRANRAPYCGTHLLPTSLATPYRVGHPPATARSNLYPRLGYMGKSVLSTASGAIDNVLVQYAAGVLPAGTTINVVNTVAGTPYNRVPAPPYVTPELRGGLAYPRTPHNPVPAVGYNPQAENVPDPRRNTFRAWQNFGRIHSTSDHFAVMATI